MAKTPNPAMDKLKDVSSDLLKTVGERALSTVTDKVGGLTDKLEDIADGGPIGKAVSKGAEAKAEGDNPVAGAVKGAFSGIKDKVTGGGGKSGGGSKAAKSTNIIESIDVGVPISVAYNQWTEFGAFPSFMKKVENVEAEEETKLTFKAQIFLSHRTWEATILEQIPDERIVWKSKGEKGHVDGAVTFHELGPNLTRILVVLEYYPQGLFEKTGNIWEAQGRRARAELRHFRRHVMTRTILEPDDVEGWRGVIQDGEVVQSHEEVVEQEEQEQEEQDQDEQEPDEQEPDEQEEPEDEYEDSDESEEAEPEDDYEEPEDEESDEQPEEEYEEPDESEEPEPEDDYEEPEEESEEEYEEPEESEEAEPEDDYEEPEEAEPDDEEPEGEDEDDYEEVEEEGEEEADPEEEYEEGEVDDEDEIRDEEPEEKPRSRRRRKS
ncbi:SRPBCC family protein [Nocardioides sp. JQ2195]|uniref:SRPBCC family protein n=1 Tax=Nocardioides sp. JQ2195 TaxID=2592334 RepID=UPI00143E6B17|nr:SRPBCC family protein [Nocardioides sp. JQ2195]QIX27079.1 SRPBCC family protein [Nocardioides sp. JQ2195]